VCVAVRLIVSRDHYGIPDFNPLKPSGYCIYICICMYMYIPPALTVSNSTFFPHSVFMCFVWIWEQAAIISLYNINWLVCITETECVYCAVRTECLYVCVCVYIYIHIYIYTYIKFWFIFPLSLSFYQRSTLTCFSTWLLSQRQTAEIWGLSKSSGLSETGQHWIDTAFHLSFRWLKQVYGHAVIIGHVCSVSLNHVLDCTLTIC